MRKIAQGMAFYMVEKKGGRSGRRKTMIDIGAVVKTGKNF